MRRIALLFVIALCCHKGYCQFFINDLDLQQYRCAIKLVDEFFERFNGTEDHPMISPDDPEYERKRYLLLFDRKMFKSFEDSMFVEATHFVDTIIANKIKIDYPDTTWMAKATCKGKFRKKAVTFDLYLTVDKRGEDMYKWTITKAEGDMFNLTPSIVSDKIMLPPDGHETNFLSLYRATTEDDSLILNYTRSAYKIDPTSVFFSYVYNGLLDIEQVDSLEFLFFQIPNYVFSIRQVIREENNSGWLITNFKKETEQNKEDFLNYIYN